MAALTFTAVAREQIAELPRDKTLLMAVWRHLERAADNPEDNTEPAPFPHRSDRRLCTFRAYDSAGREWAFSVLMAILESAVCVTALAFNTAEQYPDA